MDHKPMVSDGRAGRLELPGASIHYEVRGQGPVLLIIPGGPQDAGVFAGLARLLADRFAVVTYDPRGNSRSPFAGPLDVDQQADDAAALIEALGTPAFVFGTSGGAQIALNLAQRHAALVRTVLAHEPPAMLLLDDPTPALAADQELYDIYRRDGVEAAMGKFFADNGLEAADGEATAEMPPISPEDAETFGRVSGNFDYWLAHGILPLGRFVPDVERLKQGGPRIIVAIGEGSAGRPIAAMGQAVAKRLGLAPAAFPGDHMGFETHATAFAEALHHALKAHRGEEVMHIQFAELPVFDQDRAKQFYIDNLGCTPAADAPYGEDGWRWIELAFPGAETHLHFLHRKDEAPSNEPVLVIVDPDVKATIARLKDKGVEIVTEPHEPSWQPGRTVAEFRDSEGNRMVLGSPV